MPYVDEKVRARLDAEILLLSRKLSDKGEVNYAITKLVHLWVLWASSFHGGKLNYETLSCGYDVLSEAAAEYYRAVLGKYEESKRIANGAISELDSVTLSDIK